MSHLTLVKNSPNESNNDESIEEFPNELKELIHSFRTERCFNMLTYWENKRKELKTIANREAMLINNRNDLSEGKKRLYDKALKAFQTFADTDDIRAESEEMQSIAYDLLLYYIDKLYPGVGIEIDADNKVLFIDERQEPSDRNLHLLKYLVRAWIDLTHFQVTTAYGILLSIYSDD